MADVLRKIGEHVFKTVIFDDVTRSGKTVTNLPHPQFSLDEEGYKNALAYYGSVATLMHNVNRMAKTDSRNDYAVGVGEGKNRATLVAERGYEEVEDGHVMRNYGKGLGARRMSDVASYHLNRAKDKKLSPAERLEHLELAKLAIADKLNKTDKDSK